MGAPVQAPQANAGCERLLGTLPRECLDIRIPLTEAPLRRLRKEWVPHDNRWPPAHQSRAGPPRAASWAASTPAHRALASGGIPCGRAPDSGGLHHEYGLEKVAA